jgi:hypothetical protein
MIFVILTKQKTKKKKKNTTLNNVKSGGVNKWCYFWFGASTAAYNEKEMGIYQCEEAN